MRYALSLHIYKYTNSSCIFLQGPICTHIFVFFFFFYYFQCVQVHVCVSRLSDFFSLQILAWWKRLLIDDDDDDDDDEHQMESISNASYVEVSNFNLSIFLSRHCQSTLERCILLWPTTKYGWLEALTNTFTIFFPFLFLHRKTKR